MNAEFWRGRKVLLAPAHSELSTWVLLLLHRLGAEVTLAGEPPAGLTFFDSINASQYGNLLLGSFQDSQFWQNCFDSSLADVVLYLPELYSDQKQDSLAHFFNSQVQVQTAFLEAFHLSTAKKLVWLSSDRVYAKSLSDLNLTEESPLSPENSEATSFLLGETFLNAYREKFFKPEKFNKHLKSALVLRLSVGLGPSLQEGGLLADCAKALNAQQEFEIKKPLSVRPWIHFLDQANGVLLATQYLEKKGPKAFKILNIGAEEYEVVGEVVREFSSAGD